MSLLDRVRSSRPDVRAASPQTTWWPAVRSGALAALASWLVLALPALCVWVASSRSTVGWGEAVGVASGLWFLANGLPISVGGTSLSVVPLGLWGLAVYGATRLLGRLLARTEAQAVGTTWPAQLARRVLPGFHAGYAAFAAVAWLLALGGQARPHPVAVVGVLATPVLATAISLVRRHAAGTAPGQVSRHLARLPRWLTRAVAPAFWGVGTLVATGTLVVLLMVLLKLSTVAGLHAALGAGVVGSLALVAGQLLFLPNLGIWVVAWLAGPGFSVADGSSVTLASARPGLMPMIPVLGALPAEGGFPGWLRLAPLVPVAVGALVAWRGCRTMARLASWRSKLATAAAGAALTALVVAAAAVLGTGSAGVARLRHVGPSPLPLLGALLAELLLGAAVYVAVDRLRQRRR